MLLNSGIIENDPEEILDTYFKQCSILVTCKDLAVMAATLANQGKNPITGIQAINKDYVHNILSIMSSCGMYDSSGAWTYDVGLPAKSGVGGGIVAVLPGKSAIAVFSPLLDSFGNSVRGIEVCKSFSEELGLHIFKSDRIAAVSIVRNTYTINQVPSKRKRTQAITALLTEEGNKVRVFECSGELGFSAAEVILSHLEGDFDRHEIFILGLSRVISIDRAATKLMARLARRLHEANKHLILADIQMHSGLPAKLEIALSEIGANITIRTFDDLDHATEWCENYLLNKAGNSGDIIRTAYLSQQELLAGLTSRELRFLEDFGSKHQYSKGEYLCRVGESSGTLFFILAGYVSVVLPLASGRQQRVATYDAGSAIGEFAIIDKLPRSADVVANTDVTCLLVDFDKLEHEDSATAHDIRNKIINNLAHILVGDLRRANTEIRALGD
jgi:glutaminase